MRSHTALWSGAGLNGVIAEAASRRDGANCAQAQYALQIATKPTAILALLGELDAEAVENARLLGSRGIDECEAHGVGGEEADAGIDECEAVAAAVDCGEGHPTQFHTRAAEFPVPPWTPPCRSRNCDVENPSGIIPTVVGEGSGGRSEGSRGSGCGSEFAVAVSLLLLTEDLVGLHDGAAERGRCGGRDGQRRRRRAWNVGWRCDRRHHGLRLGDFAGDQEAAHTQRSDQKDDFHPPFSSTGRAIWRGRMVWN